jgi:hypothetical protein
MMEADVTAITSPRDNHRQCSEFDVGCVQADVMSGSADLMLFREGRLNGGARTCRRSPR